MLAYDKTCGGIFVQIFSANITFGMFQTLRLLCLDRRYS
jgi:hypothetical protein